MILREVEKLSAGYWSWRVLWKEYSEDDCWDIVANGTAFTEGRAWKKAQRYGEPRSSVTLSADQRA